MTDASMTYVARNACGCVGLLVVDVPDAPASTAASVARAIRRGMTVERVPTARIHDKSILLAPCTDNPACVRVSNDPKVLRRHAAPRPQEALL